LHVNIASWTIINKLFCKNNEKTILQKFLCDVYRNKKLKNILSLMLIYFLTKINICTHAKKGATSKNNNYRTDS